MHGFRPGLDDEKLAGIAVLGPLEVHRRGLATLGGVVVLDHAGPAGELQHLIIREAELDPVGGRNRDVFHHLAAARIIHEFELLAAHDLFEDRPEAGLQGRFENAVFIRSDGALHHVFAKPVGPADEHRIAEAGFGIDGEDHTGAGEVRAHHALDADAQGDLEVVEALIDAVADGAVREQRGETTLAGFQHGGGAMDIEIRFLLAGKTRVRQVFRGGGRAHSDIGRQFCGPLQFLISGDDFLLQVIGQRGVENCLAHGLAAFAEVGHVAGIEIGEGGADHGMELGLAQEMAVGVRRDGESAGDFHALTG